MNELSESQLAELCAALGWKGGTYHQVLAEVKALWRQNETLRSTMTVIVRDWTEQFEKNGSLAPHWVREARDALKS